LINVLIVDDSLLIRKLLVEILSQDPHIEVVGTASDPIEARTKIKRLNPDVITLDIEMPRMDGLTFLENIIRLRPMPVVMISTLTAKGADITLQALQIGAVDFITKPKLKVLTELPALAEDIIGKIKQAANANISALIQNRQNQQQLQDELIPVLGYPNKKFELIAIGASTGGTEAIKQVLLTLPDKMPPILVVQHMPPGFTHCFAKRLNQLVNLEVKEFNQSVENLLVNHVYVANGADHMTVQKSAGKYHLLRDTSDPVNRHKPSVDVLFNSVAQCSKNKAIGVILTGMGIDGAAGMKNMRNAGAMTIAQDQDSSVVWGMPRIAIEQDAAVQVLPLEEIGRQLVMQCSNKINSKK
jgi:two-component system chemotaxis response regulator CheB